MSPGDLIEWTDPTGLGPKRVWEVQGVFLGALGQESLVELMPISETPGWADDRWHPSVFVPEVLLRGLKVTTPDYST